PRNALIGMKRVPEQPAYRYERKIGGSDIRNRGVRRFEDELADGMICRKRNRNSAAERKAPGDKPLACAVSRQRERMRRFGIEQQPLLARPTGRAGIAAIRQRHEPGAVLGDFAKPADEPGQEISVTVKEENDGVTGLCRHVPD